MILLAHRSSKKFKSKTQHLSDRLMKYVIEILFVNFIVLLIMAEICNFMRSTNIVRRREASSKCWIDSFFRVCTKIYIYM